jgi:hypothetical protein
MLLTRQAERYLADPSWAVIFGAIAKQAREEWGAVSTLRVFYESGLEVEFNFADPTWLAEPLDSGTHQVLSVGFKVLANPSGLRMPGVKP